MTTDQDDATTDQDDEIPAGNGALPDDVSDDATSGGATPPEADEPANPTVKRLSDEAARYRVRAKEAEHRADQLADENRTLRLRIEFNLLGTAANVADLDAAWKLATDDLTAVEITDGQVDTDRLEAIVAHVAERYPYLASPATPSKDDDWLPPTVPSGRPANGRKQGRQGLNEQQLADRFPALRRNR